jgi:hypothetical protein
MKLSRRKRAAYECVKIGLISRAKRSDCNAGLSGALLVDTSLALRA